MGNLLTGWGLWELELRTYLLHNRKNYMRHTLAYAPKRMAEISKRSEDRGALRDLNILTEEIKQAEEYIRVMQGPALAKLIQTTVTALKKYGVTSPGFTARGTDNLETQVKLNGKPGKIVLTGYILVVEIELYAAKGVEPVRIKVTPGKFGKMSRPHK